MTRIFDLSPDFIFLSFPSPPPLSLSFLFSALQADGLSAKWRGSRCGIRGGRAEAGTTGIGVVAAIGGVACGVSVLSLLSHTVSL